MTRQDATARPDTSPGLSRRRLFALGGSAAAGVAATAAGFTVSDHGQPAPAALPTAPEVTTVPFDGLHQAGVVTPAQDHLLLTAYDLEPGATREQLAAVLKTWTQQARALTAGQPVDGGPGLATGPGAAALTVTVGVGGSLLDRLGRARPSALADLPAFAGDQLDPARGDGDLILQLCADDPLVLAQAERVLSAAATTVLRPRWQDTGFQEAAARQQRRTGRNLMGQLDGTNNTSTGQKTVGGPIWVDATDAAWMSSGTYLVVRRIRMLLDHWDGIPVHQQERVIGRHKASGAPLGSAKETDAVDLDATGADGAPLIPADSHVRLSTPRDGERMRRRGYSYSAALLPDANRDQGLLFLSFQNDPRTSFVPVQQRLADRDALSAFTLTTGSALFAVLPGTQDGDDWLGRQLLS